MDLHAEWVSCMRRGDYAGAWKIEAAVLAARDPRTRDDPRLPYHLRWVWDGRPMDGRHVLVRCYHGLGDTVQFARYLAVLRRRAASVTLECQPELMMLLESVAGVDRIIAFDVNAPATSGEADIEIMELGFALRTPPEALAPPYLGSSNTAATTPKETVPKGTIGLCWQAGDWDSERSLSSDMMARLTARPCATLMPQPTDLNVVNRQGCPQDIAGTAALMADVDRIITVDSMVAHLAGALNRPTWLLLKHDADWRWMAGRSDSPWYPSMRLYRQPQAGDWTSVLEQVAEDLAHEP